MSIRILVSSAIAAVLVCLLASGTALATVKCQCNNGTIAHAMNADYDDDDVNESCNDACSDLGGGRVWSVDTDRDLVSDVDVNRRAPHRPASPRR